MASYHCTVKAGGKGRAGPHADYIEREGKYAPEQAQGKSKLEDLAHKASGNMPAWAEHDAGIFWRAADEHERANGATYREIEVALPRELTPEQRIALVEDFINQQIGKGHAFTFAIHIPKAAIEKGDQPHAHIMYSERTLDGIDRDPEQYFKRASTKNPEKGGCKKDSAGTKERLLATRELWAKVQNAHLEKAGCEDRVSHLSLKAQGIDRQPEKHLGPIDAKKINAPALVESRSAERELVQARKELLTIDVTAELAAQHAAAREAQGAIAKAAAQVQAQQARAQAQAAHDLATAIKAKEKEDDDRIRDAAIAALAKSSAATDRHIEAAGRTSDSNRGDLESAAKGAERREFGKHLEVSAPAVREQLGSVNRILQQLVERLPNVVKTITAAVQAVATLVGQAQRKRQQAAQQIQARPQQASAPAPTVVEPALTDSDRALIALLDAAADQRDDKKAMAGLVKLDALRAAAASAYSRASPTEFDWNRADQEAKNATEAAAQLAVNAAAVARGVTTAVPYPQGVSGPWVAEHYSSYETALKKAVKEVGYHAREPRPEGFFNKKATAAYDAKTIDLQSKATGWEKEIGWRDSAFKAASAAREQQDAAHVAITKAAYDSEHASVVEKAAPLRARSDALGREQARLRAKVEHLLGKQPASDRSSGYDR